ncbi:diaminobutyrate acetyltransferase [Desulfurispirillum indicum]|nr:diaminobutyrate acetyltransferase [Desulfurispirillum indicum]
MRQTGDTDPSTITLTTPTLADGAEVYRLISQCPPLDVNSQYCYHIICEHFSQTSVIARIDGDAAGFISGYTLPEHPDILFIWQVAVSAKARGRQLATRMLEHIICRKRATAVRFLHTTISPSNIPSQKLFSAIARTFKAPMREREFLAGEVFAEGHEAEVLYEIGPLQYSQ